MSHDELTKTIVSRVTLIVALCVVVYITYVGYRLVSRDGLCASERYFQDNKSALYQFIHSIENDTIKQLPNGHYPGDLIPLPEYFLSRWIIGQNGFILIEDQYPPPDDGVYYLVYCPEGSTTFDIQKAIGRKKAFKIKVLDDHWVFVIRSYGDE